MAQLMQIRLQRYDAQPWGFRLQGGKDFAAPLVVQKINGGSLAEQAGLLPGDAVIKINDFDVFNLRHKDAQDLVVRSGNNFVVTVQRGGLTWRPAVTPTGQVPSPNQHTHHIPTVTKTSLAHQPQEVHHIGSGYNNSARPFNSVNGNDGQVKSIVNKQYNTPVGIYSDETIAETLSAQAEVLAGGVLGINFKKNEKQYSGDKSEVLKFLHEEESGDPHEPAQQQHHHNPPQIINNHIPSQIQNQSNATRHVSAPIDRPKPPSTGGLPSGQNICTECERLIVGVFVRIKDKNLHVECFKCATCGSSLKNQGYYNFNNKLYCDIHARMAAMQNPPNGTDGYVPVPIKPNAKLSATTISAALNSVGYNGAPTNGNSTPSYSAPPSNVNQGFARPYGAPAPAAAPKSPTSYPPPTQAGGNWGQPKPVQYQQPANNPYATLPRSNAAPQGGRPHSVYATQYRKPTGPQNNFCRAGPGNVSKGGAFGATSAPKRGRGIINKAVGPGVRVPLCSSCNMQIRGPFITALGRIWCPDHFMCVNANCRRPLQDIGFVEEKGDLYCEYCFEKYLAPTCSKCSGKIKGDCLNAIGRHFHPECFTCAHCGKHFGNTPFFLEEGLAYCEADWNELFTTKCFACGFPVEAGDRWVEALNNNYHSQCFNCTFCKKNLEGQSFYNKGGRPFCKNHAR